MKSHLKVKVVSLSAEMTYIRRQEIKWKEKARIARQKQKETFVKYSEDNFWSMRAHRVFLKPEARISHLAYGALKGIPYAAMEPICYGVYKGYGSSEPNWAKIEATVARFAGDEPNTQEIMQRFAEWLADAKVWYETNIERIPAFWAQLDVIRNDPQRKARQAERSAEIKTALGIK